MRRYTRRATLATAIAAVLLAAGLTSAAEKLSLAPDGTFSIVLIPDTQAYRGSATKAPPDSSTPVTNKIFAAHTRWIAENLERQRIVFASHVGDIVDQNVDSQWEIARQCMDQIHGKVPYGISVGNHDMTSRGDSTLFQKYFPRSRFEQFPWYGGAYDGSPTATSISGNNANSYQLFSAAGLDFVFLHLECNAPDDVLDWANGIVEQHADRVALITSHMGWGPLVQPTDNEEFISARKGRMTWHKVHGDRGNSPQQLWEKCYRHHPNLVAVFSGDQSRTQAFKASNVGRHGNVVHELLQDYGSGWLRMYRFHPREDRVRVEAITFHPETEELCDGVELAPAREAHQFEFEFTLDRTLAASRSHSGAGPVTFLASHAR